MKFRPWLEGAGLAMLYLLPLISLCLAPGQNAFYHQVMPVTSLTRGVLLDLLLLGLMIGLGLIWLDRMRWPRLGSFLWLPILFATAWLTERGVAEFFRNINVGFYLPEWAAHLPWIVPAGAALLLIFARRWYDIAVKGTRVYLASAGIAGVFVILPQLTYACFNHAPPEQASFSHPVRQPWQPGETRVVWILFDELSYDQVFDHPQPGIHLPAFTRLKQESVSFSQLAPVGILTQMVIPSLFLGHPISAITSNRRGELLWRSNPQMGWQRFDPDASVFGAARRRGWSTGVAGWYNPYCRLLATTLDRCSWTYQEFAGGSRFNRLSSRRSMLENARNALPFVPQIEDALQHTTSKQSQRDDYQKVLKHAEALIADTNIRFAFVHLPMPHPPGIYPDPMDAGREDYLGNLILADRSLTALRAVIEKTTAASNTILIASSDHSWRVHMWRGRPGWSQAEERASHGGQFDERPVLLVHFPGQTEQSGESIDTPVSIMAVHSLLLGIITGKITKPEDVNGAVLGEPETAAAGS